MPAIPEAQRLRPETNTEDQTMNTATSIHNVSLRAAVTSALTSALTSTLEFIGRRHAESRAAAQLHAMTDRQLADIGLHRGQIDDVVRGLLRDR